MVGKHQRLTGTPPMSTKASVASSKWSKSFCSFSHLAPPFCENKVILNRVNVSSLCPKLQNVPISDVLCENPEQISDHQKQHVLTLVWWRGWAEGAEQKAAKQNLNCRLLSSHSPKASWLLVSPAPTNYLPAPPVARPGTG